MKKKVEDRDMRELMTKAIMELMNEVTFLAAIIMRQELIEDVELKWPMATNGVTLFYNPTMLKNMPLFGIKFILAHEAMHYIQKGHLRIKEYLGYDGNTWNEQLATLFNIAQDLAINDILVSDGWKYHKGEFNPCLPGRGSFRDFPRGKDAEFYFALLKQKHQQNNPPPDKGESDDKKDSEKEDQEQDDGKGGEDGEDSSDKDQQEGDQDSGDDGDEEGEGDGKGNGSKKKGKGKGKGTPDGDEEDSEDGGGGDSGESKEEGQDHVSVALTLDELIERQKLYAGADLLPCPDGSKEGDVDVAVSMSFGFGCGAHVDSHLLMAVAKELQPPNIPWRKRLQQYMTAKEHTQPSYARPNRRRTSSQFIFPSRNNPTLGDVALVADTSGSMGYILETVAVEVHSLATQFAKSKFWIIMNDTTVRRVLEIGKGMPIPDLKDWKWDGLGGTDMAPGFVEAMKRNPSLIVCTTDWDYGFGGFPPNPNIPVIWVIPATAVKRLMAAGSAPKPPYGSVIVIEDEEVLAEYYRKCAQR